MSRSSALIILGILTVLAPYSGLPVAMRAMIVLVLGAAVLAIGVTMRAEAARLQRRAHEATQIPVAVVETETPSEEAVKVTDSEAPRAGVSPI